MLNRKIVVIEIELAIVNECFCLELVIFFDNILDVEQTFNDAGVDFILREFRQELTRRGSYVIGEIEFPVALRFPARINAINKSRRSAIENDRPHDPDAPGLDNALYLDDFVRGPAY